MEFIGRKVGVEVILTPKYHAELAGKGFEYMWACSKKHYRNLSLKEKKGKDKFTEAVRKCLLVDVITLMRIRKFAKRARQYLIAYHATDSVQVNAIYSQSDRHGPVAVEKWIGKFRTHCCAMDFEFVKFVISIDDDDELSIFYDEPVTISN